MKELGRMLRSYCAENQKGWLGKIPLFERVLNTVTHESTGLSSWEVHFGVPPPSPMAIPLPSRSLPSNLDGHVKLYLAHQQLVKSATSRRRRGPQAAVRTFAQGDLVLLRALPRSSSELEECAKLFPLYEGPYRIGDRVATNVYELKSCESERVRGRFHLSHLKSYCPPTSIEDPSSS